MSDKIRWGLLSTARINRALIPPICQSERSELVAVASRNLDKAQAYAKEWEIPTAYGSYEALLADPNIDAVYISLPNTLHCEWTVKAAEAGKHVLCEKPLVPTLAELDQIEAAAKANKVTVFEAFMYLHHPQTRTVQALVREGKVGEVQLVTSWFSFYLPPEQSTNIRLNPELAGGSLWDVGVYPNSIVIAMLGAAPVEVWAQQTIGESGVEVTLLGQMRFASGSVAQIASSFRMPFRQGTEIIGDAGILTIHSPWKPSSDGEDTHVTFTPRDGDPETLTFPAVDPYLCEVQAMEACILDGAEPVVPLSMSRNFLRSVLALYASAESGKPISL
ncbi:MAG: Gfo/Idh/MocA family oxidoreductase [Anaerolineae bacterium]|nr:Gfo/Idh/MocA family oxidoreductase [Anaerolineae bacterium]